MGNDHSAPRYADFVHHANILQTNVKANHHFTGVEVYIAANDKPKNNLFLCNINLVNELKE